MENGNQPASKADLQDLESRLRDDMKSMEDRLVETFRDGQTELLKAFYGFTESVQARFKAADATEASLKQRLSIIEERITAVERRLNLPPQQTQ